jgi:hypothetical protein
MAFEPHEMMAMNRRDPLRPSARRAPRACTGARAALAWARVPAWVGGKGARDVIGWMCNSEDVARTAIRATGSPLRIVRAARTGVGKILPVTGAMALTRESTRSHRRSSGARIFGHIADESVSTTPFLPAPCGRRLGGASPLIPGRQG